MFLYGHQLVANFLHLSVGAGQLVRRTSVLFKIAESDENQNNQLKDAIKRNCTVIIFCGV